jgi:hypothetical protein
VCACATIRFTSCVAASELRAWPEAQLSRRIIKELMRVSRSPAELPPTAAIVALPAHDPGTILAAVSG